MPDKSIWQSDTSKSMTIDIHVRCMKMTLIQFLKLVYELMRKSDKKEYKKVGGKSSYLLKNRRNCPREDGSTTNNTQGHFQAMFKNQPMTLIFLSHSKEIQHQ